MGLLKKGKDALLHVVRHFTQKMVLCWVYGLGRSYRYGHGECLFQIREKVQSHGHRRDYCIHDSVSTGAVCHSSGLLSLTGHFYRYCTLAYTPCNDSDHFHPQPHKRTLRLCGSPKGRTLELKRKPLNGTELAPGPDSHEPGSFRRSIHEWQEWTVINSKQRPPPTRRLGDRPGIIAGRVV